MTRSDHTAEQESLTLIGITLLFLQTTERHLGFCINFVFRSGPLITLESLDAMDADARKKTLGQLIQSLRRAIDLPESFDLELQSFLDNRNKFVHHLRHDPQLRIETAAGRANLWRLLVDFNNQMESLCVLFLRFAERFSADLGLESLSQSAEIADLLRLHEDRLKWNLLIKHERR